MKTFILAGMLLLIACPYLFTQKSLLWGDLPLGNYKIGFKTLELQDKTRLDERNQSRVLQIHLWYPAIQSGNPSFMPYKTYWSALQKSASKPTDYQLTIALKSRLDFTDEVAKRLLNTPTLAIENAAHAKGKFPLLIWAFRNSTTVYQSVICEFLASHGYLVAVIQPQGLQPEFRWNLQEPNFADIDQKLRDLEFALSHLNQQSFTDQQHTGVFSWSYGGETAILLQMKNPTIDVAIFLDALDQWNLRNAAKSPFFDTTKVTVPYLAFADFYDSTTMQRLKSLPYNHLELYTFSQTKHGNFNALEGSLPFLFNFSPPGWSQAGEVAKTSYELLCRYVLAHLNTYFKQQTLQLPTVSNYVIENQTIEPSLKPLPSEATLIEWGLKNQITSIQELFTQYNKYYNEMTYTRLADRLIADLRLDDALHLYELNTKLFPKSPDILLTMANTYLLFGRKADAKATLQHLLTLHPKHEAALKLLQEID